MSFGADFEALRCEGPDADGLLVATMATGAPGNRMTAALHRELPELWRRVDRDDGVRALLLRGQPDAFSAGSVDELISGVPGLDGDAAVRLLDEAREIVLGLVECRAPVVAAVRGEAYGAALGVALLSDVCVVADEARLADGHARVGVVAGDHGVLIWPLLCGLAKAKRYLLLPEPLSGAEAERIGLVAESVPDDRVEEVALDYARRLARAAPVGTRWTKRALNHWLRQGIPAFESSLAHEFLAYRTADAHEGTRSLSDGRPPRYARPG